MNEIIDQNFSFHVQIFTSDVINQLKLEHGTIGDRPPIFRWVLEQIDIKEINLIFDLIFGCVTYVMGGC